MSYYETIKAHILEAVKGAKISNLNWLENFCSRYTSPNEREMVIWVLKDLVEKGEDIDKALLIAEKYVDDPDPTPDRDDLNEKVKKGEDVRNIYTVRGTLPWLLQMIVASLKTEYYTRTLNLVEKLTKDKVYYVRMQSTIGLSIFAANVRALKNKDETPFDFGGEENRRRVMNLAFSMLRENRDLPRVLEHVANVFDRMRFINESQAKEVLETFFYNKDGKLNPSYLLEHVAPLAIFFAEFRENEQPFDSKWFKDFLKKIILDSNEQSSRLKGTLIWFTWKTLQDNPNSYEKLKPYINLFFEGKYNFEPVGQFEFLAGEILKINLEDGVIMFEKILQYILDGAPLNKVEKNWFFSFQESLEIIANKSPKSLFKIFALVEKIIQKNSFFVDTRSIFATYKEIPENYEDREQLKTVAEETYKRTRNLGGYMNLPENL